MRSTQFILAVIVLLFFIAKSSAQSTVIFNYDKGGNLTERKVQAMFGARFANFASPMDSIAAQIPELKIYPNPTSQYLTIEGALSGDYKNAKLQLINSAGVALKTDTYDGQLKTLDIGGLKPGMYILEVQYAKKDRSTYKIIIAN